jgi:hypothetical protein
MQEEYRLPLAPLNTKNRETLRGTLKLCGLLKEAMAEKREGA